MWHHPFGNAGPSLISPLPIDLFELFMRLRDEPCLAAPFKCLIRVVQFVSIGLMRFSGNGVAFDALWISVKRSGVSLCDVII